MISGQLGQLAETEEPVQQVTAARFAHWSVGEENRRAAMEAKLAREARRIRRQTASESHRHRGQNRQIAALKQQTRLNREIQGLRNQNHEAAATVRQDLALCKQEVVAQRIAWRDYGKQLARAQMEQQERVRMVNGENSMRTSTIGLEVKEARERFRSKLDKVRSRQLMSHRQMAEQVRADTSDEVTDNSKAVFFEGRRGVAEGVRASKQAWRAERQDKTEEHRQQQQASKRSIHESREQAREMREMHLAEKQQLARSMRDEQRYQQEHVNGATQQLLSHTKSVWADTYTKKYASPEELARLQASPYKRYV